ncbi:MAG TPA: hypothetical protein VJW96_07980 [Terriglobales bacterium]|jgi:hypothetical protein|nr:hypothetical protein [Terriglobales bacterium]
MNRLFAGLRALALFSLISYLTPAQAQTSGVTTSNEDKQVFLVRTVKVGGEVNAIRNEHGFPLPPQASPRTSQKKAGTSL